ncbi:histidine--tRNA ligase [Patescibacteria group bacterium]|nr:histidine--tRNA ligase [Patescibacteria group bacterium]
MPRSKKQVTTKKKYAEKAVKDGQATGGQPVKRSASSKTPQLLRGFKDVLPIDQKYWDLIESRAKNLAIGFGYGRIRLPILEETQLFSRSVGKDTDIVQKEMFSFVDAGGDNVSARPEATASIARAYNEHGMINWSQPVKLFYFGPMFRREKPQSGRQRQFYQLGFEALGSAEPVIDAQLIAIFNKFLTQLGLGELVTIQVNSIGCVTCRAEYKQELVNYFKPKRKLLCEDCKKRLIKNPLRILDCKEASCQSILGEAPQILDWLDDECKDHFMKVIEQLDQLEISYNLNPYLVRGLDYYTKTVFEIWPKEKLGSQTALGGGGRYDGLVELLGGRPTPSAGFSVGIERVINLLKEKNIEIEEKNVPQVFLAQIGSQAKTKAMKLLELLQDEGIVVAESFAKDSLKAQLELSNKLKAKYTLILGQKEVLDGTILIREMEGGVQEIIDYKKAVDDLKRKLSMT